MVRKLLCRPQASGDSSSAPRQPWECAGDAPLGWAGGSGWTLGQNAVLGQSRLVQPLDVV